MRYCDLNEDILYWASEITKGGGVPVHTKLTVSMLEDRIITKTDIEAGA